MNTEDMHSVEDDSDSGKFERKITKLLQDDPLNCPRFIAWLRDAFQDPKLNRVGRTRVAVHPLESVGLLGDNDRLRAVLAELKLVPDVGKRSAFGRKYVTVVVPDFLDNSDESLKSLGITLDELLNGFVKNETTDPVLKRRHTLSFVPRVRMHLSEGKKQNIVVTIKILKETVVRVTAPDVISEQAKSRDAAPPTVSDAQPNSTQLHPLERAKNTCIRLCGVFDKANEYLNILEDALADKSCRYVVYPKFATVQLRINVGEEDSANNTEDFRLFLTEMGLKPELRRKLPFGKKHVSVALPECVSQNDVGVLTYSGMIKGVLLTILRANTPRTEKMPTLDSLRDPGYTVELTDCDALPHSPKPKFLFEEPGDQCDVTEAGQHSPPAVRSPCPSPDANAKSALPRPTALADVDARSDGGI